MNRKETMTLKTILLIVMAFVITLLIVGCTKEAKNQSTSIQPSSPLVEEEEPIPKISTSEVNNSQNSLPPQQPSETEIPPADRPSSPGSDNTATDSSPVREIIIKARNWEFEPAQITVNKGDIVRLVITSEEGTHGFNLPAYNLKEKLEPGKTVTIEFIAEKEGTFPFSCYIPCGRGHGGMAGELIVE